MRVGDCIYSCPSLTTLFPVSVARLRLPMEGMLIHPIILLGGEGNCKRYMSCSRTQHNLLPCAQAQTSGSRALHTNHKAIVASASHFMVRKCFSRARPAEIWQRKSYLTWRPRRCWSPELEYQRPGNPAARRRERWWRTWQQSHQRLWRTDGKKKCLESRSTS